ncbi:MAG: galactokinase [Elusimicrobia bacterium]|nr:galactokinase [Elusimicrobiota bacterium]
MKNRIANLKKEFQKRFGKSGDIRIFSAPGRVNLIGEHTDYNGGYVLPIAIDRNVLVTATTNGENILRLQSLNFEKSSTCSLDKVTYNQKDGWANYPKGVVKILQEQGHKPKGINFLFEGNIPIGSGLSSSAAIEVVSCLAITTLSDIKIKKQNIPILCQTAENEFIGMKCGIMDQFVITYAKKNTALFIDCRSLEYEHIPLSNPGISIVIADTKKKRELVDSEYNTRREQCEEGVKILKQYLTNINQLRDISSDRFEKFKNKLPFIIRQRCEHIIYENERVLNAKILLKKSMIKEFGILMNESHNSCKTLYQISCPELDTIVETAQNIKGVLGSRMTGAGFGGCTVSLVKKESINEFTEKVSTIYKKKFQIKPEFYICNAEDGAKKIKD